MNETYVGLIIADVHVGAIDPLTLHNELRQSFLSYIESLKVLDFIVIAGDLFDSRISLNSEHAKQLFYFLRDLIQICSRRNIKLRILKGTESHDNKQLEIIKYISTVGDVKIISTVSEEDLFDNLKVLYIPEEYMNNMEEFYDEFLNNKTYDMIFGHGLVSDVAFIAKMQESEVTMSKAPVFDSNKLLSICKGPIFFGHIHKPQCIKDRLYYVGSFSRWVFGEEEKKGFMSVAYTPDTGSFQTEFIENKYAKEYNTMIIDYKSDFYKNDANMQIEHIISLVNNITVDKLRIIFNIPEDYPNPTLLTNLINDVFSKYSHIKVIIKNNSKEKQKKEEMEKKIQSLIDTYDFIFDKGIKTEEKLSRYIKIKYNKDISVEQIRQYIYEKINQY